ncbi:MAG TPA: hypothetical protein VFP77_09320 [Gemmatimonadaceae bacterium]|nr:hypothetical protein [Gemmatimonadaceae bacterium]
MSNALEEFRAQRKLAEEVHTQVAEVGVLLRSIQSEAIKISRDDSLRKLLREEETWLSSAQDLVREVARFRDAESREFWPAVWRRWAMAVALTFVTGLGGGVGYVWSGRAYEAELAQLRSRVELLDSIGSRVISMTPAERRQLDTLLRAPAGKR